MNLTKEQIQEGVREAYKQAGHNACFDHGFKAGIDFALAVIKTKALVNPINWAERRSCQEANTALGRVVLYKRADDWGLDIPTMGLHIYPTEEAAKKSMQRMHDKQVIEWVLPS